MSRSSPAVVLGFNALQLSDDRDPLAPHAEPLAPDAVTMRALVKTDRLHPPRPELAADPPRIRERDPASRAALGYLSANCGGCHNDRGPSRPPRSRAAPRFRAGSDGRTGDIDGGRLPPAAMSCRAFPKRARASSCRVHPNEALCSIACGRGGLLRRCRPSERRSRTKKRSSLCGIGSRA